MAEKVGAKQGEKWVAVPVRVIIHYLPNARLPYQLPALPPKSSTIVGLSEKLPGSLFIRKKNPKIVENLLANSSHPIPPY